MIHTTTILWLALLLSLFFGHARISADQGHGKHAHDGEAPHSKTAENLKHTKKEPHQHRWGEGQTLWENLFRKSPKVN